MKQKTKYQVFISALTINLIVGITYIWSIIAKELTNTYGWSATQSSFPYMIALASMPFAMIISGMISDKGHARTSTFTGSILWGIGLIICGLTNTFLPITIGYGLFFGIGVGLCTGTTTATAVKWFPKEKKGEISGIAAGAIGFSSVYMSFVFTFLIQHFGLSRSLLLTGIVGMIIMATASLFMKSPVMETTVNTVESDDFTWKEMIHTSEFRKLWTIFVLGDSGALMLIGSIASIAKVQAGIDNAALIVMTLNLSNSIGRILIGSLSDKIGIKNAFRFSLALQLINLLLFRFYNSFGLLLLGAALAGIAFGGIISLLTPSTGMFGSSHLALNGAVVNTAYGAGAIIMPYISAYIVDLTGSYYVSYLIAAVLVFGAILVTFTYAGEPVEKHSNDYSVKHAFTH